MCFSAERSRTLSLTQAQFRRVRELFEQLEEAPTQTSAEVVALLEKEEAAVRDEVVALMHSSDTVLQALDELARDESAAQATLILSEADETSNHRGAEDDSQPAISDPDAIPGYRLLRLLGEGGMGVVYEAEQFEPVRRRVAIKRIRPGLDSKAIVARFRAEQQALAVMDHPGIARVFYAGTDAQGLPYFVMELIEGEPLTTFCRSAELGLRDRLELFASVCDAVQHAHQKGVIHRDLKPGNVLVLGVNTEGPQVAVQPTSPVIKVIDFGIARAVSDGEMAASSDPATRFTRLGDLMGTPEYMSPEQCMASSEVDERADLYSLGCILYELIAGFSPFHKESAIQTLLAHVNSTPAKFDSLGIPVPARVQKICFRLLEKNADNRYQTAEETQAALDKALRQLTRDDQDEFDESQSRLESASFKAFPTLGLANTEPNPLRLEDYLATDYRNAIYSEAAERSLLEAQETTASMEMSIEIEPVEPEAKKSRAPLFVLAFFVVAAIVAGVGYTQLQKNSDPQAGITFAASQVQTSKDIAFRSVSSDIAADSAQSYGRVLATKLQTLAPYFLSGVPKTGSKSPRTTGMKSGGNSAGNPAGNPKAQTGPRTQKEIERTARGLSKRLMTCYGKRSNPDDAGAFGFKFRVGPDGRTDSVSLTSRGFSDSAVESCLVASVKKWKFRADPKGTIVHHERRVTFGRRKN